MCPRSRFPGTAAQLADKLRPLADTPSFVRYYEDKAVSGATTSHKNILRYRDMLAALQSLAWNLSFARVCMTEAMQILLAENSQ
eukprot:6910267-Alexandrium_andersonii.AAC.1